MINPKKKKRPYLDYDLEGYIKGQQTARTDATSNLQATTLRLVAENNTSEKVLLRRVANERRKTLEAYEKGKRDYERQQQAAKVQEDIESRPWWNPTTVLRNAKDIPIFGAAPTATEWAYGLMNKAVGNDAVGDYYMLDADKSATGQAIALAAIPAHTNPYTAALYDTALLAPWAKELDVQGKFYHPETLTGEEAAMLGLSFLPFGIKYRPLLSYAKTAAEDAALQSSLPWVRDNARGLYLSRAINLAVDLGVLAPIKVNRTVERDGTIRMSLPSHTSEQPRLFVIDPLGNNKYYIHMKTWDGKKVPANLSAAEKNALFESVYNELPEGAEILFPQSSSEYLGTRGTVAGLQRLSRDPRFEAGSPGTLLYWDDKTKSVKTYTGTSFIKKPLLSATLYVIENSEPVNVPTINWDNAVSLPIKITEENAATMTPKQWTAAQDYAIARGDWEEAQRLRDLHSKVAGDYIDFYHGTTNGLWTSIDPKLFKSATNSLFGSTNKKVGWSYKGEDFEPWTELTFDKETGWQLDSGEWSYKIEDFLKDGYNISPEQIADFNSGKTITITRDPNKARMKTKLFKFRVYPQNSITINNPYPTNWRNIPVNGVIKTADNIAEESLKQGHDVTIIPNIIDMGPYTPESELYGPVQSYTGTDIIVNNPKRLKLQDAVTYDDNGVRIPLGERDNFNINDTRYGFIPWLLGAAGTTYGVSNLGNNRLIQVQKKGGKILPPWY